MGSNWIYVNAQMRENEGLIKSCCWEKKAAWTFHAALKPEPGGAPAGERTDTKKLELIFEIELVEINILFVTALVCFVELSGDRG